MEENSTGFKLENISKDRDNFHKLVLEKKHEIDVEKMVLAFCISEYLLKDVKKEYGKKALTDEILFQYFRVSAVLSNLLLITVTDEEDFVSINTSFFPPACVDIACVFGNALPFFSATKISDSDVICNYRSDVSVPRALKPINNRVKSLQGTTTKSLSSLLSTFFGYFTKCYDEGSPFNLMYVHLSGCASILEDLMMRTITGQVRETTRQSMDVDRDLAISVFNSFDCFTTRYNPDSEFPLTITFDCVDEEAEKRVVKEALDKSPLSKSMKESYTRLLVK